MKTGEVQTFYCVHRPSSHVKIDVPYHTDYLSLCEVEIYGYRTYMFVICFSMLGRYFKTKHMPLSNKREIC